jgi:hypothetical protein
VTEYELRRQVRVVLSLSKLPNRNFPMPASVETVAVVRIACPIVSRFAALLICWLFSPGSAFSQPANINLVNLNSGQLCVLGNQAGYGLTFSSGV